MFFKTTFGIRRSQTDPIPGGTGAVATAARAALSRDSHADLLAPLVELPVDHAVLGVDLIVSCSDRSCSYSGADDGSSGSPANSPGDPSDQLRRPRPWSEVQARFRSTVSRARARGAPVR